MCSFGSPTALPGCLKVLAGDIDLGIKFILLLHEFGVRIPHVQPGAEPQSGLGGPWPLQNFFFSH